MHPILNHSVTIFLLRAPVHLEGQEAHMLYHIYISYNYSESYLLHIVRHVHNNQNHKHAYKYIFCDEFFCSSCLCDILLFCSKYTSPLTYIYPSYKSVKVVNDLQVEQEDVFTFSFHIFSSFLFYLIFSFLYNRKVRHDAFLTFLFRLQATHLCF